MGSKAEEEEMSELLIFLDFYVLSTAQGPQGTKMRKKAEEGPKEKRKNEERGHRVKNGRKTEGSKRKRCWMRKWKEGGRQTGRQISKTLILKDSNFRSIWTHLTQPVLVVTTNTNKHAYTTQERERQRDGKRDSSSNLVFYAQSTIAVISRRRERENASKKD